MLPFLDALLSKCGSMALEEISFSCESIDVRFFSGSSDKLMEACEELRFGVSNIIEGPGSEFMRSILPTPI